MPTLYSNFAAGTITDAPLLIGATTVNSAAFANLPTVASPDTMWLVLDPEGSAGAPEIVQVTAHTAAATACTIVRAQQSTVARQHAAGTTWRCALTKSDADTWEATTADVDGASAGSANALLRLDANARGHVNDPLDVTHIVNKQTLDATGRGVMGYAERTTDLSYTASAIADVTGVSVTFTAVAGRRYRVTCHIDSDGTGVLRPLVRESSTVIFERQSLSGGEPRGTNSWVTNSSISGSKTWKLSIAATGNATLQAGTDSPAYLLIEDIGAL